MSATATIALPDSLFQKVVQRAKSARLSAEQWVEVALRERIRLEQETAEFFNAHAARASGRRLGEILDESGNNPPDPGDELEP
jgi:hypothetical protein